MTPAICYFCEHPVVLTGETGQRCRACDVPLNPPPAWVAEAGWPDKPVPSRQRSRLPHHALAPIKRVRFHGADNRVLARRIEYLAQVRRCGISDLLLHYIRLGFNHEHGEADSS